MLVDDPVKRVDNMTMAWGLEARVPFLDHELVELAAACPPELKAGAAAARACSRTRPARSSRPRSSTGRRATSPCPALIHLEGPLLDLVRDALTGPAAKQRGLFGPDYVDRLLRRPQRAS